MKEQFIPTYKRTIPNRFEHLPDGTTVMTIQKRNGDEIQCLFDTADFNTVSAYQWHVLRTKGKHTSYVATYSPETGGPLLLHRLLLRGCKQIDHVDRNGLNNCRANLRRANQSLNNANQGKYRKGATSQYKGVSFSQGKFVATIKMNRKQTYLGCFDSEEAAAIMYNIFAKRYFGEFANLNTFQATSAQRAA